MKRITKFSRILLAGTAALALAGSATLGTGGSGPAFIQPAAAANIQIDFFYDPLSSHGSWIDHRRHGYVFIPAVGSGWRPYTHGHWVYTDAYGWYWESEEPFAWATYHYGRWGYDPAFGWYWVPGNVWGPAWVTWRYGGGNVGWAPIGPGDHDGYVYGTPDYYEPPVVEAWVFVPEQRMVALDVARYVTPVVEVNLFLGKARERHHVRYRDGRAYNGFLPRERVTKFVNKEVNIYNITTVDSPDQLRRGNDRVKDRDRAKDRDGDRNTRQIRAFRTEIADTRPNERPRRVAKSADEIKSAPRLKQTAKGKRPEGAPPSVADLGKQDNIAKPGDDSRRRDAAGPRPEERKPGDAKPRDARSPDAKPRDGRSRDARSRDDRPGQVERRQDGAEKAKPADPKQTDRKQTDRKPADPKQTDRRENADRDNRKPKAAQPQPQQKQRERQNAAPKPDSRTQRSREAAPKRNDQPKGERRGSDRNSGQQKQQARPERQPQQKQATPPQNRNARPQQKQATPERNRKAAPQRESRGAPQAQPNAKRQQRPAPQQAERQGRREVPANRGGGRQKQERGGPNR